MKPPLALMLFSLGAVAAETLPASYDVPIGKGRFHLSDVTLSKSAATMPVLFTATVANETGANWKELVFEIHMRRTSGDSEFVFNAHLQDTSRDYAPEEVRADPAFRQGAVMPIRIHIPGSETNDVSDFAEYNRITVHGKIQQLVPSPGIYSGLVVEEDCLNSLPAVWGAPEGVERRRKLLELVTLRCAKFVEDAVLKEVFTSRVIGTGNNRRVYRLANMTTTVGVASGWIDKSSIRPGGDYQYVDYVEPAAATKLPNLHNVRP